MLRGPSYGTSSRHSPSSAQSAARLPRAAAPLHAFLLLFFAAMEDMLRAAFSRLCGMVFASTKGDRRCEVGHRATAHPRLAPL